MEKEGGSGGVGVQMEGREEGDRIGGGDAREEGGPSGFFFLVGSGEM